MAAPDGVTAAVAVAAGVVPTRVLPEGSDAEEDEDKQADQRTRRRSMSVSQTEGSWCRCYSCLTLYYYKQCRCHVRCLNGGWKCKA
jgi:hypothetical protein